MLINIAKNNCNDYRYLFSSVLFFCNFFLSYGVFEVSRVLHLFMNIKIDICYFEIGRKQVIHSLSSQSNIFKYSLKMYTSHSSLNTFNLIQQIEFLWVIVIVIA